MAAVSKPRVGAAADLTDFQFNRTRSMKVTGVFTGTFEGFTKKTKGAKIQIARDPMDGGEERKGPQAPVGADGGELLISPIKSELCKIKEDPDQWASFLRYLGTIPFYRGMSLADRESWLLDNAVNTYQSLRGLKVRITLLTAGSGEFQTILGPERLQRWASSATGFTPGEILALFHELPENANRSPPTVGRFRLGNNVREVSLIMHPHFWSYCGPPKTRRATSAPVLELLTGKLLDGVRLAQGDPRTLYVVVVDEPKSAQKGGRGKRGRESVLPKSMEVGILVPAGGRPLEEIPGNPVLDKWIKGEFVAEGVSKVPKTPSVLKSAMQKVVRLWSRKIKVKGPGKEMAILPSGDVFVQVFNRLLMHPGALMPTIQTFVRGVESALKRAVVILAEDVTVKKNGRLIVSLLAGALLARHVTTWTPSHELFGVWSAKLRGVIATNQKDKWDSAKGAKLAPCRPVPGQKPLKTASWLLDTLGSFVSDQDLLRHLAHCDAIPQFPLRDPEVARAAVLPMWMCLDQHCCPQLAFVLPSKWVPKGEKQFPKLFRTIFTELSGYNPRRSGKIDISKPFRREVLAAMRKMDKMMWPVVRTPGRVAGAPQTEFQFELHPSALAGMAGTYESGAASVVPMVSLETGFAPVAIPTLKKKHRKPEPLTDRQARLALAKYGADLAKGLNLKEPFVQSFEGAMYRSSPADPTRIQIQFPDGRFVDWETARHLKDQIPKLGDADRPIPASQWWPGMVDGFLETVLPKKLVALQTPVLRSLSRALAGFPKRVDMPRLSRDGSSRGLVVTPPDCDAFVVLMWIACYCPSALRRDGDTSFESPNPPLLWTIRDLVNGAIRV